MPEIPEVNAFGAYITKYCLHREIIKSEVEVPRILQMPSKAVFERAFAGEQFATISRQGKYLIIALKKSKKKLVMHFGLTGFLVYVKQHQEVRFSCAVFIFKDQSELHYNSVRKFGKLWLVDSLDEIKGIRELGADPLAMTEKKFLDLMAKNGGKKGKIFLMDQKILAGIGNEYSDEILFQAGIDPRRALSDLSISEKKKMFTEMKKVLRYAIALRLKQLNEIAEGGFFSRGDAEAFKSTYLQAHRHGDGRCPHNKNHLLKHIKIGGRTSYFCPIDQR